MDNKRAADEEVENYFSSFFKRDKDINGANPRKRHSIRRTKSSIPIPLASSEGSIRPFEQSPAFSLHRSVSMASIGDHPGYKVKLPKEESNGRSQGLDVISTETVADLISGAYDADFDDFTIIDCRFDFEYEGGHIRNALSINCPYQLVERMLRDPEGGPRRCFIFHCEFSKHRAPKMCKLLRDLDRKMHDFKHYPHMFYPELYIMKGGYQEFFQKFPHLCHPQGYRQMDDPEFISQCKMSWSTSRRLWRRFGTSRSRCNSAISLSLPIPQPLLDIDANALEEKRMEDIDQIRPFSLD